MPRELPGFFWLLVDQLVPVEANVVANQVVAQPGEHRVGGEPAGCLSDKHRVRGEHNGSCLGNGESALGPGAEKGVGTGFDPVECRGDFFQITGSEGVLDEDESLFMELVGLVAVDHPVGAVGRALPGEPGVPRVGLHGVKPPGSVVGRRGR